MGVGRGPQRPDGAAPATSPAPTSAGVPPVIRTSSANEVGNTVCACPAAAQTTSCRPSHWSTSVRSGRGWPTGATPPMTWPVASRTNSGSARLTRPAPTRTATFAVSTRCAPLVSTSSGAPSALKTRLLAIAPTSQPSWLAAATAVGAGSGSSLTCPLTPSSRRTSATRSALGCIPGGYRTHLRAGGPLPGRGLPPRRPGAAEQELAVGGGRPVAVQGVLLGIDPQLVEPALGVIALFDHIGHAPGGPAYGPPDSGWGAIWGCHGPIIARGARPGKW